MSARLSLMLLVAVLVAGCANPGARIHRQPVVGAVAENLPRPDGLDHPTAELLRREGLLAAFRSDPAAVARQLRERWGGDLTEERRAGLASVCSAAAGRAGSPEVIGFHLAAAELAWPLAIAPQDTAERRRGRAIHTHSSGEIAERLFKQAQAGALLRDFPGPYRPYQLRITIPGDEEVGIGRYDTLVRANRLKLRQMDLIRHRVEGLGADLVLHRQSTPERMVADPLLQPSGLALPVNANLVFGRRGSEVDLEFHDLTLTRSIRIAGRNQPLCADFTAPYAVLLNNTEMAGEWFGIKALVNSSEFDRATGIYQVEPWREDQIPVIFVHGLASSPVTWLKVLNEFSADPQLQARYQFLAFRYPTGYPIARNAASLRRHLYAMRKATGHGGGGPLMKQAVLVGHSMGGILSNLQIRSSGEEFRRVIFEKPLDELGLTEEQRGMIKELCYFEADPNIGRAVFIASPHRGSNLAKDWIGRLASRLIRMPLDLVTFGLTGQGIQGTTSLGNRLLAEGNDSIKTLKPNNPTLSTTLGLPLRPGVRYHSIIGNHKMTEPLEESTDTVVDYWSSHLDDAASESVVDATHLDILRDDAAIEELRRLLYLHAGLRYDR